ncbi:MoaD/ThiS family protein [Nocardioides donggukensis]|uniref:MoaD/ThiS family protein n=1 Tax=Nocardioides donggukensis TaxID=2774019 RepID=A0A927K5Y6_9ACTN|nr:MoaD/ThiS family protein [Nocardioides donggukensis]MBD8868315.1 MoaD/ThiS family protein [Nocardioides donggukensis]
MSADSPTIAQGETHVLVRYWAGARAAAGVAEDRLPVTGPVSLADVRTLAVAARDGSERLAAVLATCSALVGDAPAGRRDPADVVVVPGQTVEFLPPFAGG